MFGKYSQLTWLLIGIVIAGAAVGTYLYRQGQLPAQQQAALDAGPDADADPGREKQAEAPAGDEDTDPVPKVEAVSLELPKFDVLRVEPDGSAVIAGWAPGSERVELLADGDVIATARSAANGDFVIALDRPLEPGAYELTLRGIAVDGRSVDSEETGVVNVPGDGDDKDDVIAMVDREGAAPRILQRPGSDTGTAQSETEGSPGEGQATADAEPDAGSPDKAEDTETAALQEAEKGDRVTGDAVTDDQTALQAEEKSGDVEQVVVTAVDVEDESLFIAGRGEPGRDINIYLDGKFIGTANVGPESTFLLEAQRPLADGQYEIRADMLAPDGGDVERRAAVRLIHEAPRLAQDDGQPAEDDAGVDKDELEVAEAAQEPAANADEVSDDQMETAMTDVQSDPGPEADAASRSASDENAAEESGTAVADTGAEDAAESDEEGMAVAESGEIDAGDAEIAGTPAGDQVEAEQETASAGDTGSAVREGEEVTDAAAAPEPEPQSGETVAKAATGDAGESPAIRQEGEGTTIVAKSDGAGEKKMAETAEEEDSAASEVASGDEAAQVEEEVAASEEVASGGDVTPVEKGAAAEEEVAALPVIRTGDTVIIRRGDNLWRISRRMLGRGIRYTVIYEANRDQIRDPHLIYPGQIFDVPDSQAG